MSFDGRGNIVFDNYIRRIEKANSKLSNNTVKVYRHVSQFWNFDPRSFFRSPCFHATIRR